MSFLPFSIFEMKLFFSPVFLANFFCVYFASRLSSFFFCFFYYNFLKLFFFFTCFFQPIVPVSISRAASLPLLLRQSEKTEPLSQIPFFSSFRACRNIWSSVLQKRRGSCSSLPWLFI